MEGRALRNQKQKKPIDYITVFGCTLMSCMAWWERRGWTSEIYMENQAFKQETVES